jgi:tetratricopeptide (TPR) repeat protein
MRVTRGGGRASISIPLQEPHQVHRLVDAEVGDTLLVVTALGPARGFLKPQEFVEFNALASTHGVVIQPLADDLVAEASPDKIVIGRPAGLTLSSAAPRTPANALRGPGEAARRNSALDAQAWGFDREANFRDRQTRLIAAAAAASEVQRAPAQLELARFYLARDLTVEAKGVLDVAASDERAKEDSTALALRAIANVMLGRGADAMKDLVHPSVAKRNDITLWRALALAQQGKWVEAREGFRSLETAAAVLPVELQRLAFQEAARAAVEVRDFGGAATLINEVDTLGPAQEHDAELTVLKGRVMEGLGRLAEALTLYRGAADHPQLPAAARARLREIALRQSIGEMNREDATFALESLTMGWRGDETEAEALQLLGRLYAEDRRYRDAFQVMRTALTSYPRSEMTRRIQDEAAAAFDSLFLGGKGDSLPAIDALSLFYDFRDLTPVGRRGDEMIRKLADRLVAVDLLDQAAELLQHQVDNRLQGAARAQVAVRLSVIYLIARKPDRALAVLRATRSADLPNELRSQRLLIEARAQSDVGRPDVALEAIANIAGPETERLRADILWKARRWRDASEQMEKMFADRWRDFAPLTEAERADVMRAAIGYALGEDTIGLDRFRSKYAPKMAEGPDRRAFEVVTAPFNTNAPEFGDIARVVAATDTLEAFLRDIRARFPETTGPLPGAPAPPSAAPAVPERGASAGAGRAG